MEQISSPYRTASRKKPLKTLEITALQIVYKTITIHLLYKVQLKPFKYICN